MLIDWFTVLAQIFNFLILIWILKHFLYAPILNAINARRKQINSVLQEAELKKKEAEKEGELLRKKTEEFEREKEDKKQKVKEEIEAIKINLLDEAKSQVEQNKLKWEAGLKIEKENVYTFIRDRVKTEIFSIARQAIRDLANVSLEEHIIHVFFQKLQDLSKERNISLFFDSVRPLQIKTAEELSQEMKNRIINNLSEKIGKSISIQFVVSKELISGVELLAENQKISWNVVEYLSLLESRINDALSNKG